MKEFDGMKAKRTPSVKVRQIEDLIDRVLPAPSPTLAVALLYLCHHADDEGTIESGAEMLAQRMRWSLRQAQSTITRLVKAGVLERTAKQSKKPRLLKITWRNFR